MVCIVVTNHGWGAIWRFESVLEAEVHPGVQVGVDAVLEEPPDLLRDYNRLEFPKLMRKLRLEGALALETRLKSAAPREAVDIMRANLARVWEALEQQAAAPPHNPEKERLMAEAKKVAEKAKEEKAAVAKAAEPKVTKEPKVPTGPKAPKGTELTDVISFGKTAEGKPYHPTENNPKRPGSGSHARFALYREGQTIGEALDAGVETADIIWDIQKSFIIVTKAKADKKEAA